MNTLAVLTFPYRVGCGFSSLVLVHTFKNEQLQSRYSYTTAATTIVVDGRASLSSLSRLSIELLSYLLLLQPPYTAFTQTTRNDYKVNRLLLFFTPPAWVHFFTAHRRGGARAYKQPYTQTQYTRHTIIARGSSRTASNLSGPSHSPAEPSATSVQFRFLGVLGGRYHRCVLSTPP